MIKVTHYYCIHMYIQILQFLKPRNVIYPTLLSYVLGMGQLYSLRIKSQHRLFRMFRV